MVKRDTDEYAPAEEQGIKEEQGEEQEPQEGEKESDVYTAKGREELVEDGEISASEEGFMEGAEGKGELANCAHCGKVLSQDKSEIVEREIDDEIFLFCCDECAEKGPKK